MNLEAESHEVRRIPAAQEDIDIIHGIVSLVQDVCNDAGAPAIINPVDQIGITIHATHVGAPDLSHEYTSGVEPIPALLGAFALRPDSDCLDLTIQVVSPDLAREILQFGTIQPRGVAKFSLASIFTDAVRAKSLQDRLNAVGSNLGIRDTQIMLARSA